ncbi:putative heme d1 biosynthesis radical SAM protein NirJ2 [Desulfofundulus thermobenzoicus]|uniref:Putative heme d1 biosynthesis radical SAM protein NirJ2 n=1 Tax=Desulfofundulus thermobenzoicus TaxID=29376 RepID=A0A6N7IMY8_9FIRM|nr:putative heme d1 biosynthesis radical SAM protein NirJ2 [Desulfofundulus thermobenzoicus]MQL51013.1 putative heme d1 biosynthesis radical SAM protein NirJ2 [Desulfofundulus thermobenzoicus]
MLVSWNTTNACNLACAHCYRDAGARAEDELSSVEAAALIDEIARAGFKIMIFSGGEPLLRPDIYELVRYAAGRGLRPVFGTNGTLITGEVAEKLKRAGALAMGISLDSTDPGQHDRFRGRAGSWQAAVEGMQACHRAGLPFQIHTTVVEWNYHQVEALTDLAVQLGAVAHHVFFLVPTGRAVNIEEESLRAEQYERLLHRLMKKQREVPVEVKPTCAPQFMRIAARMGLKLRFQKGCLAGTGYCIINPVGDVQPCAYLNIPAGNIRETPFQRIWEKSPVFLRLRTEEYGGGCGSCRYRTVCGGCRARAYFYHGDYMAEEPWCLYRKGREAMRRESS